MAFQGEAEELVRTLDQLTVKMNQAAASGEREQRALGNVMGGQWQGAGQQASYTTSNTATGWNGHNAVIAAGIGLHATTPAGSDKLEAAQQAARQRAFNRVAFEATKRAQAERWIEREVLPIRALMDQGWAFAEVNAYAHGIRPQPLLKTRAGQSQMMASMEQVQLAERMASNPQGVTGMAGLGNMAWNPMLGAWTKGKTSVGDSWQKFKSEVTGKKPPPEVEGKGAPSGRKGRSGLGEFKHWEHKVMRAMRAYGAYTAAMDIYDALEVRNETDAFMSPNRKMAVKARGDIEAAEKWRMGLTMAAFMINPVVGFAVMLGGEAAVGAAKWWIGGDLTKAVEKASVEDLVRAYDLGMPTGTGRKRNSEETAKFLMAKYKKEGQLKELVQQSIQGEKEGYEQIRIGNLDEGARMLQKAAQNVPEGNFGSMWRDPGAVYSMLDQAAMAKRSFARTQMARAGSRTGD